MYIISWITKNIYSINDIRTSIFLICKKVANCFAYSKVYYRLINNLNEKDKLKKLVESKVEYFFLISEKGSISHA